MKKTNLNKVFGYIEGYYGNLLDWKSRKKIIKKMSSVGMNFYFYAPKEDLYHRLNWRNSYTKMWRKKFRNFCSFAMDNNIKVIAGISPGLDFNYFSIKENSTRLISEDLEILITKFFDFIDDGASDVALLLDDIPGEFDELFLKKEEGEIHALLSNLVSERLNRNIFLVPRIYADELMNENRSYLNNFLEKLDANTQLFYCGKYIVNNRFETKSKIIKERYTKNKVIFWDNYYANDYCPKRLILGPWLISKENKKVMLNLTGMIETDLLILEIASKCKYSNNKGQSWRKVLEKNNIPNEFLKIYKFFEKPNLTNNKKIINIKVDEKMINYIDQLLWRWKTPLSREWYPYLLSLKQDLQIMNNQLPSTRILKTQSYPIAKKILKMNGV